MTYSTIPRMRSAVIVGSGHLFPLLAEPTELLLAATVLVIRAFWAGGDGLVGITDRAQENSEYVRRLLQKTA